MSVLANSSKLFVGIANTIKTNVSYKVSGTYCQLTWNSTSLICHGWRSTHHIWKNPYKGWMNAAMDVISKDQSGFLYTICMYISFTSDRLSKFVTILLYSRQVYINLSMKITSSICVNFALFYNQLKNKFFARLAQQYISWHRYQEVPSTLWSLTNGRLVILVVVHIDFRTHQQR